MENPNLEELVKKASQGDSGAFEALVRSQTDRLKRHVNHRIGVRLKEALDADDVIQETFLKACKAIENFVWNGEAAFFYWLSRIAEHVILKASQKQRVFLQVDTVLDDQTTPGSRAVRQERQKRLEEALMKLSPDHQKVIRLTRIEGHKIAEVALKMDRSPNAVKKLLARALDQLRLQYGESTGSMRLEAPFLFEGGEENDG